MNTFFEFAPLVFSGLGITVSLALVSLALAIAFGIAGAALKLSDLVLLSFAGSVYTTLVRGIPDLVLMLIIFFGGQMFVNYLGEATGLWDRLEVNQFAAGSFTIGFIFGAYMTETFRGAFLGVPKGQSEAAAALGMHKWQVFLKVQVPQIIPLALPSFTNNWLVLLKTTALVSIIGLQDVIYNAGQAGRSTQEPFMFLLLAFFIYLGLTALSDVALRWVRDRYTIGAGVAHGH